MRSKYWCPMHKSHHYYDSKIGIECLKRMNKTEIHSKARKTRKIDMEEEIYVRYIDNESQLKTFNSFKSYEPFSKIFNFIEADLYGLNDEKIDKKLRKAEKGDQEAQEWILEKYIDTFLDQLSST